jgi:hypothetical protein
VPAGQRHVQQLRALLAFGAELLPARTPVAALQVVRLHCGRLYGE